MRETHICGFKIDALAIGAANETEMNIITGTNDTTYVETYDHLNDSTVVKTIEERLKRRSIPDTTVAPHLSTGIRKLPGGLMSRELTQLRAFLLGLFFIAFTLYGVSS